MASKNDITRRIKNDISRKSGIKSQYASNKISSLKNTINFNAQRISSQPQRPSNLNSRRTLKEINFNAQRVADQFNKRTPNIKDKNVLNNELDYNKLPETLAKPSNLNDRRELKEINFNAQRAPNQSQRPSNLNDKKTLQEINFNAQRVLDQLGKRPLYIKDKDDLNNELDYNKLPETLANRSIKIGGPKITPEIPLLTGDFLVRENDLLIATETDKLIEIDSA